MSDRKRDHPEIPDADSVRWFKCSHCENLHVHLIDENDNVFATATFDAGMIDRMKGVINDKLPPNDGYHER